MHRPAFLHYISSTSFCKLMPFTIWNQHQSVPRRRHRAGNREPLSPLHDAPAFKLHVAQSQLEFDIQSPMFYGSRKYPISDTQFDQSYRPKSPEQQTLVESMQILMRGAN
jgi:hypothetical protein